MTSHEMFNSNYLNLRGNFQAVEGCQYDKPSFETKTGGIKWSDSCFNEPRKLSIKQVRDIFFSLLNQSEAQQRISMTEVKMGKLHEENSRLSDYCHALELKLDDHRKALED